MTAQDVITQVREQLKDVYDPFRWSDEQLFVYLTEGCRYCARHRPDYMWLEDDPAWTPPRTVAITRITALTDVLQLNDMAQSALVHYVVQAALNRDAEDTGNSQNADRRGALGMQEMR
jgi:hypothetical protein